MARELKQMIVKELVERYDGMDRCVVVDLTGLKATTLNEIRADLAKQSITLSVVRNSLAAKAFSQVGLDELGVLVQGPSALATGGEDSLNLVKTLVECASKDKQFVIRGSMVDGTVLVRAQTIQLSKIPGKEALQAQFLSMMQAPISGLLGVMTGVVRNLLGVLTAIRDKEEH